MSGSRRSDRRRWLDAGRHPTLRDGTIAVLWLVLPGVATLILVQSHHHVDVGGVTIPLSIGLPTMWLTWAILRTGFKGPDLAQIADELADRLRSQWAEEAEAQGLYTPYPLAVAWTAADPPLAGDLAALEKSAVRAPGLSLPGRENWAKGPEDLAGDGDRKLADVLETVPTGRLVVLGEPGTGKTMLMVSLVLDLLDPGRRSSGGPVPVLASLASWDPVSQDLHAWLGATLIIGYPDLATAAPRRSLGRNRFEALLAKGLILPILDGLDEVPDPVRAAAIAQINEGLKPGERVVVTCRTEQYQAAVRPQEGQGAALTAAAVQLSPLEFSEVADYLRTDAGPGKGRWDFLDKVEGGSPARQALATPLMAGLARAIYNPRPGEQAGKVRDPAELRDQPDRMAIESLLFDEFIPAAYRQHPAGRWKPQDAERWLMSLARHLEKTIAAPDIAWWQLHRAASHTAFRFVAGLVAGVVFGIVTGVVTGVVTGLLTDPLRGLLAGLLGFAIGGLVFGLGAVLAAGYGNTKAPARGIRISVRGLGIGLAIGLATGLLAGLGNRPLRGFLVEELGFAAVWLVFGFGVGLATGYGSGKAPARGIRISVRGLGIGLGIGLVTGLVTGLVFGIGYGLFAGLLAGLVGFRATGLAGVPRDVAGATTPRAVLARDRLVALVLMLAAGLMFGLLFGFGLVAGFGAGLGLGAKLVAGLVAGLVTGLVFGPPAGFTLSIGLTAWPSYTLTRGWLALHHQLPWSLMDFLADAHRRGVLRQTGAVYQFRHLELQRRLAARDETRLRA